MFQQFALPLQGSLVAFRRIASTLQPTVSQLRKRAGSGASYLNRTATCAATIASFADVSISARTLQRAEFALRPSEFTNLIFIFYPFQSSHLQYNDHQYPGGYAPTAGKGAVAMGRAAGSFFSIDSGI
jgi:hypothetical protein